MSSSISQNRTTRTPGMQRAPSRPCPPSAASPGFEESCTGLLYPLASGQALHASRIDAPHSHSLPVLKIVHLPISCRQLRYPIPQELN